MKRKYKYLSNDTLHVYYNVQEHIYICILKLEAQEAEPVLLNCLLAKKFQRRRFFNESANQKQDLSGGLVFLSLG